MLFKGTLGLDSKGCRAAPGVGGTNAGVGDTDSSLGDGGAESPRMVVFGRKREAMMTR